MHRWLSLSFVFILACASGSAGRPEAIAQPTIRPALASPLYFGSGSVAPATIDVEIFNNASVPLMVRRVEIDSPQMASYVINRSVRDVKEVVPPKGSITVLVNASATTGRANPTEPLTLRAIVEFEHDGHVWREIIMTR